MKNTGICAVCGKQTCRKDIVLCRGCWKTEKQKKLVKKTENRCLRCNRLICDAAQHCKSCSKILEHREKISSKRPSAAELQEQVKLHSRDELARKYGVSNSAISLWLHKYNIQADWQYDITEIELLDVRKNESTIYPSLDALIKDTNFNRNVVCMYLKNGNVYLNKYQFIRGEKTQKYADIEIVLTTGLLADITEILKTIGVAGLNKFMKIIIGDFLFDYNNNI